jgi:hypothetical protein
VAGYSKAFNNKLSSGRGGVPDKSTILVEGGIEPIVI